MIGGSADDAAKSDNRVELPGLGKPLDGQRDLNGPRDADAGDVVRIYLSLAKESVLGAFKKALGDKAVES